MRSSGNFAIDAMVIGDEWNTWKHVFIADGIPHCSIREKTIYSPAFKTNLSQKEEELIRGKNLHEAAHAHYTPDWETDDVQLHSIVNALEDLRIERLLAQKNPLFGYDLRKLNEHTLEDFKKMLASGTAPISDPMEEALGWMMFDSMGFESFSPSPKAQEYIDESFDTFKKWKNMDAFVEIVDLAKELQKIWNSRFKPAHGEAKKANSGKKKGPSSQDGKKPLLGNDRKSSGLLDSDNIKDLLEKMERQIRKQFSKSEKPVESNKHVPHSLIEKVINESFKKMKETTNQEYLRYTGLDKFETPIPDPDKYEKARKRISAHIMRISQYTRTALQTMTRCKKSPGQESGLLDRRKLAALATGCQKNIFYRVTKGISLNTAITILIDASGSMRLDENSVKSFSIALAEAFDNLQIPFEILGFTTYIPQGGFEQKNGTRSIPLLILTFKKFEERYAECKYRIGSYKAMLDNVDGESLEIAWNRNRMQKADRHIVFVISDGSPLCIGISPRTLDKDLFRVVKLIRNSGGEVYAFGLNIREPAQYYGEKNFVFIKNVSDLSASFFENFKRILSKKIF